MKEFATTTQLSFQNIHTTFESSNRYSEGNYQFQYSGTFKRVPLIKKDAVGECECTVIKHFKHIFLSFSFGDLSLNDFLRELYKKITCLHISRHVLYQKNVLTIF